VPVAAGVPPDLEEFMDAGDPLDCRSMTSHIVLKVRNMLLPSIVV
jgi:hypothetical protein